MARIIAVAGSEALTYSFASPLTPPYTIAGWFAVSTGTAQTGIPLIAHDSGFTNYVGVRANGSDVWALETYSNGPLDSQSGGAIAAGWHHIAIASSGVNARSLYIDGSLTASSTQNQTAGLDSFGLGVTGSFIDAYVQEAGAWNVALGVDDIHSLAIGYSPLMVRPDALIDCFHIFGNASPEPGLKGGSMVLSGTCAKVEHHRQIYPTGPQYITTVGATVQLLRPESDVSAGAWTPSTGSDLFAMLDESTYSDADYITTSSASTAEVAFGTGLDPASSSGHIIRYRAKGTGTLTVELYEGATLIATDVPAITGSFQTFTWTLSGAEADDISDYADLRLRFVSS